MGRSNPLVVISVYVIQHIEITYNETVPSALEHLQGAFIRENLFFWKVKITSLSWLLSVAELNTEETIVMHINSVMLFWLAGQHSHFTHLDLFRFFTLIKFCVHMKV